MNRKLIRFASTTKTAKPYPLPWMLIGSIIALGPAYYLWKDNFLSRPTIQKPKGHSKDVERISGVPLVQHVLVGAGTAGYHALLAIKESDPNASILMIGNEVDGPYQRTPLSKELWFEMADSNALTYKDWQGKLASVFYDKKTFKETKEIDEEGVSLMTGVAVEDLNLESQVLTLSNGQRVQYGKLLIATGGTPRTLDAFNSLSKDSKSRVTTFRTVKDFQKLDEIAQGGKTIAVVGGGFLGSELAIALGQRAKTVPLKVIQLFPEDGNMGLVLPRYLTNWTTQRVRNEGITVIPGAQIEKVESKGSKLVLNIKGQSPVEADHVIVAAGLVPNTGFAERAGVEVDKVRGGLVVNAELESRSNVFVAGDVSSYHDIALGRRRVEHHDHAVASGRLAGLNMTGAKKPYLYQSMFWSDLGPRISYEAVGVIDSKLPTVGVWSKKHDRSSDSEEFDRGIVFYLTTEKKVVGVLAWNMHGQMDIARQVLREARPNADLDLLASHFNVNS